MPCRNVCAHTKPPAQRCIAAAAAAYSPEKLAEDNAALNYSGSLHDLALIKLAAPSDCPGAAAPLLPTPHTRLAAGNKLQVVGAGTHNVVGF